LASLANSPLKYSKFHARCGNSPYRASVAKPCEAPERSEAKAPQPHFHFNENAPTVDLGEKAEG